MYKNQFQCKGKQNPICSQLDASCMLSDLRKGIPIMYIVFQRIFIHKNYTLKKVCLYYGSAKINTPIRAQILVHRLIV